MWFLPIYLGSQLEYGTSNYLSIAMYEKQTLLIAQLKENTICLRIGDAHLRDRGATALFA